MSVLLPRGAEAQTPTPAEHFGFEIGTDRCLADWSELSAYYEILARTSPRVTLDTLGLTTRGRPFLMLTVTSEANQARIDELHAVQMKLADPRTISDEAELQELLERGRTVVLITHAIHSTEVGSAQMAARLLHRLTTSDDPETLRILDEVVLLDIPSLNPDGTQWVVDWYERWVGTDYEAAPLPWLYHFYVGHDNNRDWYAFTQDETRHTIVGAHNRWHPQIVHDVHQMGSRGARIFFPPYIDPIEHNVDPALVTAVNRLGTAMAAELTAQGKSGVVVNAIYDGFTPARAYQHYHGGARILSETASADLASPLELDADDLGFSRGFDPRVATWNHPLPWEGGRWGLPEIVDHMEAGALALLGEAARDRRYWLENFHHVNERAVGGWEGRPAAWVIPSNQENPTGSAYLLRILRLGDVEVHRAAEPFEADGIRFPAGSLVVPMDQPWASFVQTLLEVQEYPDLREYPGGPPKRPYDVTAHTLGLLMDVVTVPLESFPTALEEEAVLSAEPIPVPEFDFRLPEVFTGPDAPRVALLKTRREPMESGWTRWVFDQYGLPYDTIGNERVRGGSLTADYDVILLQSQSRESLRDGWSPAVMPPQFAGGLGAEGAAALAAFVRGGGRIVAIEEATDYVAEILDLDLRNAVERLPSDRFFVPGSILEATLEPGSPITAGMGERTPVWYWGDSRAFDLSDPEGRVLARYAGGNPLLSGWILGPEHLAGKPALVEIPVGRGSVVLFGFQPNYRAQSVATWPLLFNALNAKVKP